jgi:hypothetical protein
MSSPENEDIEKTLTTLGVGPAAKELYVDLLRPASQEMGSNLVAVAKLVTAALLPLHAAVWGLDRVRDWLSMALVKRLANVPPENIQQPPAYLAGQVLLQLPFCVDQDHLRERYADLLAAAMNREQVSSVHASFAHVISQMSPDEALLLGYLRPESGKFSIQETWENDHCIEGDSIPVQFRALCERVGVSNISLSDVYFENLLRLGIFREALYTEGRYHPAGHNRHGTYEASIANGGTRVVDFGEFGERFLATCVRTVTPVPASK